MRQSIFLILAVSCFAQAPQPQLTPQQLINSLISNQTRVSADIVSALTQIPALIEENTKLQNRIKELEI